MSSSASTYSIELRIPRSLALLRAIVVLTGTAAFATSNLPWYAGLAGTALLVFLAWHGVRHEARQWPARLVFHGEGVDVAGAGRCRLAGYAQLGTLALVLWLEADGGVRRLFLPRDALDGADFRRLRAALRLGVVGVRRAPCSAA